MAFTFEADCDGVLGLAAAGTPASSTDVEDFDPAKSYIKALYDAGSITEKTFSLHIDFTSDVNYIDFGAPQDGDMRDEVKYVTLT